MSLALFGNTPAGKASINSSHQDLLTAKLADFSRQEDEIAAAERACGITAAKERARAASDVVDVTFNAVLFTPVETMADVRAVAAYLVELGTKGAESVDVDTLVWFVQMLAGEA